MHMLKNKIGSHIIRKNNSKWIYDINIRAKTIEHLEKYIKINLLRFIWQRICKEFLDLTPKVQATKEKIKQTLKICIPRRRKWQPTPVVLPGESQGRWSLMGCRLRGHSESDTTEAT